ncbi:cell envelope-related function transcriptional attenuator common domain protein [Acididesulfobacillus acetoxydans]|uniref:Cell envelope-related function transcriptional attenuator common domain protein n=1 Tax=Acididesulfobacillus acetoxydans TaxID=1561005 RepID=A0A8S0VXY1_9FIRM|nr:LCP family protein [Acididesulfobacillus acetoxydans]CAA7602423.1 cell envelope-related function transcriptional attenuator common domain protein [Acididesulfobacillus acetoxydans]CEJ08342.1 Cell envelope-related transcriptional attenuator domain [Acididesulfobacillus acetoxydans]
MNELNKYYRVLQRLLPVLVVILLAVIGLKYPQELVKSCKTGIKQVQASVGQAITRTVSGQKGPVNVLLIGNNARDAANPLSLGSAGGQADILIVAHIDPDAHVVSLISIPRDTLVAMPNWQEPIPKIKSSFELGLRQSPEQGPAEAMKRVSELTGLKIKDYIATDFKGFEDAINAVGGIKVNIPQRLYDPEHSQADFYPGLQTLNGQEALAFIRVRQNAAGNNYRTDDFQRQEAELQVLNLLKQKLLTEGVSLSEIRKLHEAWQHDVVTNVPTPMLLGLGLEVSGSKIEQVRLGSVKDSMDIAGVPLDGVNREGYLSGAYYDVLDPREISKKLEKYGSVGASTGLPPLPIPQAVRVDVYGAQAAADQLREAGFNTRWQGDAAGVNRVEVAFPPGQLMSALAAARSLGTGNELVLPSQTVDKVTVYYPS